MGIDELLSRVWDVAYAAREGTTLALDCEDCRTILDEIDRLKNRKCAHQLAKEFSEGE